MNKNTKYLTGGRISLVWSTGPWSKIKEVKENRSVFMSIKSVTMMVHKEKTIYTYDFISFSHFHKIPSFEQQ